MEKLLYLFVCFLFWLKHSCMSNRHLKKRKYGNLPHLIIDFKKREAYL